MSKRKKGISDNAYYIWLLVLVEIFLIWLVMIGYPLAQLWERIF